MHSLTTTIIVTTQPAIVARWWRVGVGSRDD